MIKYHKSDKGITIAELIDYEFIIKETQDALDLICDLGTYDCDRIIISKSNFHADFFRLGTGLAGDILQKFSNYGFKLAIIGDFSNVKSNSLRDFIRESNKGNLIYFLENTESALLKLSNK